MMNPHISLPRQHGGPAHFGSTQPSGSNARGSGVRMPRFFKRLFKFPQMDFEMAIWEMTSLLVAPKKVFRSIYYHKQTKNTWHRPDPSFTYLLSFFLLLTSFAWSLAYTTLSFSSIVRVALVFIFIHFLASSLLVATAFYFLISRVLSSTLTSSLPGAAGSRRHATTTTTTSHPSNTGGDLEFGYCFDVAIRAFFPLYLSLYVIQFVLMPLISRDYWISLLLANSLHLLALTYYTTITFLAYNALPFLSAARTRLLLSPLLVFALGWLLALAFGFNLARWGAPVLWCGVPVRGGGLAKSAP